MFNSVNRSMLPLFSGGLDLNIPYNIPNLNMSLESQYITSPNGAAHFAGNYFDGTNTIGAIYGSNFYVNSFTYNGYMSAKLSNVNSPVLAPSGIWSFGNLLNTYTYCVAYNNLQNTNTEENLLLNTRDGLITGPNIFVKIYRPFGADYLKIELTDSTTNQIIITTIETTQGLNILILNYDDTTKILNVYINGTLYTGTNLLMSGHFWDKNGNAQTANVYMSNGGVNNFWVGWLCDQYIYNRILSNAEINILGNFLAKKFAGNWTNI